MSDVTRIIMKQAQEAMLRVLRDSTVTHMNAVAVTVWVGYDMLLTMGEEIDTIWRRSFASMPSIIYFVTRYFGFGFLVYNAFTTIYQVNTVPTCLAWGLLQAISIQIVASLVNGLLAFRVYAFFHGNKRVKWFIITLFAAETIIEITMTTLAKIQTGEPIPPPNYLRIAGCISDTAETPMSTITSWVTNTAYSLICFGLIAYRFLTVYFEGQLTSGIAEKFLHDGAFLFAMLCGSNVVNIILLYAAPKSPLIMMGFSWFIGAGVIASSRTVLSLRSGRANVKSSITEYEVTQNTGTTRSSKRQDLVDGLDDDFQGRYYYDVESQTRPPRCIAPPRAHVKQERRRRALSYCPSLSSEGWYSPLE